MKRLDDPSLRVLIVEDEALLAMQVEQLLLEAGHEPVGHAMDADEALDLCATARADLALVDVQLRGGMNGVELMRLLTRDRGMAGLFLTANRRLLPEDFAGAVGVISKPFSETGFQQALDFVVRHLGRPGFPHRPPPVLELAPAHRLAPGLPHEAADARI